MTTETAQERLARLRSAHAETEAAKDVALIETYNEALQRGENPVMTPQLAKALGVAAEPETTPQVTALTTPFRAHSEYKEPVPRYKGQSLTEFRNWQYSLNYHFEAMNNNRTTNNIEPLGDHQKFIYAQSGLQGNIATIWATAQENDPQTYLSPTFEVFMKFFRGQHQDARSSGFAAAKNLLDLHQGEQETFNKFFLRFQEVHMNLEGAIPETIQVHLLIHMLRPDLKELVVTGEIPTTKAELQRRGLAAETIHSLNRSKQPETPRKPGGNQKWAPSQTPKTQDEATEPETPTAASRKRPNNEGNPDTPTPRNTPFVKDRCMTCRDKPDVPQHSWRVCPDRECYSYRQKVHVAPDCSNRPRGPRTGTNAEPLIGHSRV